MAKEQKLSDHQKLLLEEVGIDSGHTSAVMAALLDAVAIKDPGVIRHIARCMPDALNQRIQGFTALSLAIHMGHDGVEMVHVLRRCGARSEAPIGAEGLIAIDFFPAPLPGSSTPSEEQRAEIVEEYLSAFLKTERAVDLTEPQMKDLSALRGAMNRLLTRARAPSKAL